MTGPQPIVNAHNRKKRSRQSARLTAWATTSPSVTAPAANSNQRNCHGSCAADAAAIVIQSDGGRKRAPIAYASSAAAPARTSIGRRDLASKAAARQKTVSPAESAAKGVASMASASETA